MTASPGPDRVLFANSFRTKQPPDLIDRATSLWGVPG